MCPFYNAYLFEITGTTKGVFTHSQSSCHIAKVVLAFSHDSRQIPIASDAPPRHTSRGFLHWRLSDDGPGASRIVPDGRHPKPFTNPEVPSALDDLVSVAHLRKRHRQSRRSGGLEIDEQLNSGRLVNSQVNGFGALTGAFVFELR